MVKCYQYTADGYYAGEAEDYGLLPNNATRTAPTLKKGFVPCWDGKKWVQVEDHKGECGYVNGQAYTINAYGQLPEGWSATQPEPTLLDVQTAKRHEINAGFDAALTASLTMPSRTDPPSAVELAIAIVDFRVDDPTGLTDLQSIHEARRAALLAAVDAATTVAQVQSITVSYAV